MTRPACPSSCARPSTRGGRRSRSSWPRCRSARGRWPRPPRSPVSASTPSWPRRSPGRRSSRTCWTGSSAPTSCARAGTRASSCSAIRSCAAPSTTRSHRPGGSSRTSGRRPRSRGAERRWPRARSTSPGRRATVTRPRSRCWPRPRAAERSPAAAARRYAAALRLLAHDDPRRGELLAPLALALTRAGQLEDGRRALVEALALRGPDLELVLACAQVEAQLGRHADARARLHAAYSQAPSAALAFELATSAMLHGHGDELHEWAERAARDAHDDPVLRAGADALRAHAAALTAPPRPALRPDNTAPARLEGAGLPAHASVTLHVGRAQLRQQRYADAAATFGRALAIAREARQGHLLVHLHAVRAIALWMLLDLDGALAEVEAAEAARADDPHQLLLAVWLRAVVHHHRGEPDLGGRAADRFARLVGSHPASELLRTATCHVASLRAQSDPERCLREMLDAAGPTLEHADQYWVSMLLLALVRAAIGAGRLEEAQRWAGEAAARDQLPAGAARAACARAEVLLARGDARAAAALAEQAADAAERLPAPLRRGRGATARGPRARRGGGERACQARAPARRRRRRPRRRAPPARRRLTRAAAARHAGRGRRPARRGSADRARAPDRRAGRAGPLEQAGRRGAVPQREDGPEHADADLREGRRPLAQPAHARAPHAPCRYVTTASTRRWWSSVGAGRACRTRCGCAWRRSPR